MKIEIKWVVVIFIVHVLWHLAEKLMGFYNVSNDWVLYSGVAFTILYAVFIYAMLTQVKKSNRGFLHRRQALLSGLFVGLSLVVLTPVLVFLLNFVIEPGYFDKMILMSLDAGEYNSYGEAAIEYGFWNYVIIYMARYLLIGVLAAAFFGFVMHEVPEPATE